MQRENDRPNIVVVSILLLTLSTILFHCEGVNDPDSAVLPPIADDSTESPLDTLESDPIIVHVPDEDATATFDESIWLYYEVSPNIRLDSNTVYEIQEGLRLARSLDSMFAHFYTLSQWSRNRMYLLLEPELDSLYVPGLYSFHQPKLDSMLYEYGFDSSVVSQWSGETRYMLFTDHEVNMDLISEHLLDYEGVSDAYPQDHWHCGSGEFRPIRMMSADDTLQYQFTSWGEIHNGRWLVCVADDSAFFCDS